jgi:SAM-dependent methyltransferase
LDRSQWEYLIADDGVEDDGTGDVVLRWQREGLPIRYFTAADLGKPKVPGVWRDGSGLRNAASLHATGQYIAGTYPEVLLPAYTLEAMVRNLDSIGNPMVWLTTIPYWLPPVAEEAWRSWSASSLDFDNLHKLPGFYDPSWPSPKESPGSIDYRNQNQEQRMDWQSDGVFWAMPMHTWRWLGGFREYDAWGCIDMDFWYRRRVAGIETRLPTDPKSRHKQRVMMVYHQEHGDSPRDLDLAMETLRIAGEYHSVEHMRSCGGIASSYHHGPRERALARGVLDGVDETRLKAYRDASQFVDGLRVVDLPCETGYGAAVLRPAARAYIGVDHDWESVDWASSYAKDPQDIMVVGSVLDIPLPKWTADVICCFGLLGALSCDETERARAELRRVLKPGGRLLLLVTDPFVASRQPVSCLLDSVDRAGV